MAHSVYWIRCKEHTDVTSQGYVGVSINAEKRFEQHLKRTQNRHLGFAIKKYGWDNIIKSVLLIGDKEYCLDIEKKLRPADKIGWNLVAGGGHPPILRGQRENLRGRTAWNKGKKMPSETVEKVRAAVKLQMQDPAHRERLAAIKRGKPSNMAGKHHTVETIEKIRKSKIGTVSKKLGTHLVGAALENVQAASRVEWTCPHCHKIGRNRGAANRWHFDKCKERIAE